MKRTNIYILSMMVPLLLSSCSGKSVPSDPSTEEMRFRVGLMPFGDGTRSEYASAEIEDRITSVSLFIYQDDRLICSDHYETDFSEMTVELTKGGTYDVYALVNMGDMTGKMPDDKAANPIENVEWNVPSFLYVKGNGLPMSGKAEGFIAGDGNQEIPLKRLFAKVSMMIGFGYEGASVTSVDVRNINGSLAPFGVSAAKASSSLLTEVTYDSETGTYVFYVPENMQGLIGTAEEPHEKNPDIDPDIASKKELLTFVEIIAALDGTGGYRGSVTYRSYLGNDDTGNFDIKGNCRYRWNMKCLEGGLSYNDWKTDTGSISSEFEQSVAADPYWDSEKDTEL